MVIRGVSPEGNAGEVFAITDATAKWQSQFDAGSAPYVKPAYYAAVGGPVDTTAWMLERLLASPDKTMSLLPGGQARAEKLTTAVVGMGAARKTVTAWAISGLSTSPLAVWADADSKFFALTTFVMGWLPEGYEGELAKLLAAQTRAMAERSPALVKKLVKTPAGPVAFTDVRMYDAPGRTFVAHQTVVVEGSNIVAVGPANQVKIPTGAQVFDGKGKTLVPGMWDAHLHFRGDATGPQELSLGITSVRDPGNNNPLTIDRAQRARAGLLLTPNVYASSMIDGRGPNSANVATVVTSEAEAIAAVKTAKEQGFVGVKFYGTFNPDFLKPTIAEAHKQGLHVHGHVPRGIRPMDAINAGYDEITHINWVIMQAMPDSIIQTSNGANRFEGPGRYAKDVKLDQEPMKSMIRTMAAKKIVNDPTLVTFEGLYVPEKGDLSPAYAPFKGTMPPTTERSFRRGGDQVPKDLTRADYRASYDVMKNLVTAMYKAGVPIVAGTDGSGLEIIRELELYVDAGMTPGEALATATIMPAELVGVGKTTGSIEVGKTADLVLIEGDPSVRIGDLRQTRVVMLGGKLMDADELRTAAGFSGRPK
jgi:imidazolonepropionase-like amidohydrolase